MRETTSRRRFLRMAAAGGGLAGMGDLSFLGILGPVSEAEARVDLKKVRLDAGLEPTVRLLEETPRDRLLEEMASRIQRGLSYREVLAALLLAGVRNLRPRPVGFKFHAVLAVNSAHLASLAAPDTDRWLPLFWGLDYFKDSQAAGAREGDWALGPVDEAAVPSPAAARRAFAEAMEAWDEAAVDAATAGLARSAGANEVFDLFARYGARDFRDIGHKAIFVANGWRALQTIGWRNAEPVLRSIAYALQEHGSDDPSRGDAEADRPFRRHPSLAARFPEGWRAGKPSADATRELLAVLRSGSWEEAGDAVTEHIVRGVAPASLWDAVLAGAAELLARQPGIVSIHAVTTANALRFSFEQCGDDATRRMLLLQAAAFTVLFRRAMEGRGKLGDVALDRLEPERVSANAPDAVEEVFAAAGSDRLAACRKALGFLQAGGSPAAIALAARRLVFRKGGDPHDYKFSSAVLEDFESLASGWSARFLAASLFHLPASSARDNPLVGRIRTALAGPARAF